MTYVQIGATKAFCTALDSDEASGAFLLILAEHCGTHIPITQELLPSDPDFDVNPNGFWDSRRMVGNLSATCKAAENDCLERRNSIRPCVPSHAATCKAAGNDCLAWRTDQTAHPIARNLRGKSGEATDRSKPSDNVPTLARVAPEP
jgi:hypothetical protein